MLSRWARQWTPRLFEPIICFFARLKVTANMLTIAGLILAVGCGMLIAVNHLLLAAGCLLLSGLLDALDGELARHDKKPNTLGPFIDSIADHYGDFAIYFGFAWRALLMNDTIMIVLVLFAMFGSLIGSQIRSRAGMLGIDTKNVGFFTRAERNLVLLFGLFTGWVAVALGLLALFNNLSALQRILYTLKNEPTK